MGKKFHTGGFLKDTLKENKKVAALVAKGAGISPQNLNNLFKRSSVPDDQLAKLSESSGLDLIGMVYAERTKDLKIYKEPGAMTMAAEPDPILAHNPKAPFQLVLNFDPDDEQMSKKMEQIRRIMKQK